MRLFGIVFVIFQISEWQQVSFYITDKETEEKCVFITYTYMFHKITVAVVSSKYDKPVTLTFDDD